MKSLTEQLADSIQSTDELKKLMDTLSTLYDTPDAPKVKSLTPKEKYALNIRK